SVVIGRLDGEGTDRARARSGLTLHLDRDVERHARGRGVLLIQGGQEPDRRQRQWGPPVFAHGVGPERPLAGDPGGQRLWFASDQVRAEPVGGGTRGYGDVEDVSGPLEDACSVAVQGDE